MKKLFTFGLFVIAIALGANTAAARGRIPYGTIESMTVFGPTKLVGNDGEALTLCVLRTKYHLVFLGAWSEQTFVFAGNNCDTDSYYAITRTDLVQARKDGDIEAGTPDKPPLTFDFIFYGFSLWWAGLGLVVLLWLKSKMFPKPRLEA